MSLLFLDDLNWVSVGHCPLEDELAKEAHQNARKQVNNAVKATQIAQHCHQRVDLSFVGPFLVRELQIYDCFAG